MLAKCPGKSPGHFVDIQGTHPILWEGCTDRGANALEDLTTNDMTERDAQFLEHVVKELVDNPNDVKINRTVDEMGVLLTLDVHAADMGKIIGRAGSTAKAIRTLLRVVGLKNNARVNLKINEPVGGMRSAAQDMQSIDEVIEDLKV